MAQFKIGSLIYSEHHMQWDVIRVIKYDSEYITYDVYDFSCYDTSLPHLRGPYRGSLGYYEESTIYNKVGVNNERD